MTTGFRNSAGTDLDAVFDPYVQGTSPSATGFRLSTGVDINTRFAPITFGTAAGVTGMRISSGADLNTLFAAYGTAHYSVPGMQGSTTQLIGRAGAVSGESATGNVTLAWKNDGTFAFTETHSAYVTSADTFPLTGTWLPAGWSVSDCELQISYVETVLESQPATKTNPAVSYVALSTTQNFLMSASTAGASATGHGSSLAMTALIKQVSTGAVLTTTFTVELDMGSGV